MLNGNDLRSIPDLSTAASTLEILGLIDCQISHVPATGNGSLMNLPRLKLLYLSENKIDHFPLDFVATSPILERINLKSNLLRKLDPQPEGSTFNLVFSGNPIDCCDSSWIKTYAPQSSEDLLGMNCDSPPHLASKTVRDAMCETGCEG